MPMPMPMPHNNFLYYYINMNMLNVIIVVLLIVILIIRMITTEMFQTEACEKRIYSNDYPETINDIYDSVSLYKQYNLGANSKLSSIYYSPDTLPSNLKNRPNTYNTVAAGNEGAPVFNDLASGSTAVGCSSCQYVKDEAICKANMNIIGDTHCPKLLTCTGATPMGKSVSYKQPKYMEDDVLTDRGRIDMRAKYANIAINNDKQINKSCCDLQLPENDAMRSRFSQFVKLYMDIRKAEMEESMDATNTSGPSQDNLQSFFDDTTNQQLFAFPNKTDLSDDKYFSTCYYIMMNLITKYSICNASKYNKC
jgi:hypothetical protein